MYKPDLESLGSVGLNQSSGMIFEEFLPQLAWPNAANVYKEMADNDPTIGAILYMSKQLVRKASWSVECAGDSAEDKRAAEFLESCMQDMSCSWDDFISEVLSCFVYGWSFHEVVYKVRKGPLEKNPKYKSKYSDGMIGWRKMPIRAQSTLVNWEFDESDHETLIGMTQMAPPTYKAVTIPLERGLLFRTEVTRDNPEGRSLLRNAYRPWYFKKRIEEIEGIGIERDLAGLPVLTPPDNINIWEKNNPEALEYLNKAQSIVTRIRRDTSEGVVKPYGWDLKLLSTGGSRQFDTNAIINRYDQRIAITMLADIVMLGADKVGSFALADVKKSLLAASLEAQINSIADILNKHAVPKLMIMNNFQNLTDYPRLVPGEIEVPGLKELGDFIKATGMNPSADLEVDNFLRSVASLPQKREVEFNREQQLRDEITRLTAIIEENSGISPEAPKKPKNGENTEDSNLEDTDINSEK